METDFGRSEASRAWPPVLARLPAQSRMLQRDNVALQVPGGEASTSACACRSGPAIVNFHKSRAPDAALQHAVFEILPKALDRADPGFHPNAYKLAQHGCFLPCGGACCCSAMWVGDMR